MFKLDSPPKTKAWVKKILFRLYIFLHVELSLRPTRAVEDPVHFKNEDEPTQSV